MKSNLLLLVSFAAALMGSSLRAEAQAPAVTPSPAGTPAAKTALTKTELRKLFEDQRWVTMDGRGSFIFHRGGKLTDSGAHLGHYTLEAPDILKMYRGDPKNPKATFKFFRVNAAAKTAQQDGQAGTMGGNTFLKYDGPAKRVK